MKVKALDPLMWQVTHGNRWWTVSRLGTVPASWNIQNEAGRQIDPKGRLGKVLTRAVFRFEGSNDA